jgi:hypothetical protein
MPTSLGGQTLQETADSVKLRHSTAAAIGANENTIAMESTINSLGRLIDHVNPLIRAQKLATGALTVFTMVPEMLHGRID